MDDLIQEFLIESNENLDRLESDLVKLEADPKCSELLASIFRSIHSIKGTCGFLGFNKLQALAHAGESLLSKLRDGVLELSPQISTALLATGDAIRQMLAAISTTGQDGEEAHNELIETLKRLQEADSAASAAHPGRAAAASPEAGSPREPSSPPPAAEAPPAAVASVPPPASVPEKKSSAPEKKSFSSKAPKAAPQPAKEDPAPQPPPKTAAEPQAAAKAGAADASPYDLANVPPATEESRKAVASVQDSTIRVNVTLLDRLMNLVGELVLARNQVMQYAAHQDDAGFLATTQQLNLVTSELRESVMKTRMQPISRLFDKVPRVVRDVSVSCGKQVRIETDGRDTELDRTLLEAINDPLTHLVRNAVDHGIEPPARRAERGKPAEGLLTLRALHEGGQVTIEISDDGAGIDAECIRAKAVERGVITADRAAHLTVSEALNLIFLPGVSTAEKVTSVSGRGVGMDVVRTNIERVGGSVEIQTRLGQGTTFKVKVPLTLAPSFPPSSCAPPGNASPFPNSIWSNWSGSNPHNPATASKPSTVFPFIACAGASCRWST